MLHFVRGWLFVGGISRNYELVCYLASMLLRPLINPYVIWVQSSGFWV